MTRREHQFRVLLYHEPIGRLYRRENYTRFVFDSQYLQDPKRAVLGLRFEEAPLLKHASNMRLPTWFSNLLPEGRLRQWISEARGVSVDREIELLVQVGHDLPGAVTVLAEDAPIPSEMEVSDAPLDVAQTIAPPLWRFSLAGVGLKFSMLAQGDRFTAPAFGEGGDWIVKLPDPDYPEVPRNELAMMTLAGLAGINVPITKLVHRDQIAPLPDRAWPQGEAYAYAVKRFDRGENRELIHIEDLAQVRGLYPEDKYTGSFETVAALVYRRRDAVALVEFARRLAFNVLIGNGDAHLKNWSLIYTNRRTPTLSPAYDLVATSVYRPPGAGEEDLGLKFGSSKRFEVATMSKFAALGKRLNAHVDLSEVAADVARKVLANWSSVEHILENQTELRAKISSGIRERATHLLA